MTQHPKSPAGTSHHPPQVGAPDPERRNSPIYCDPEQSFELLRLQVDESAGCYFNDVAYPEGAEVASGSTFLRCDRGVWVDTGVKVP